MAEENMNNTEAFYPLSPMQQGILFHVLYAPEGQVYFQQFICTLQGDLNVSAFTQAWQKVLGRHAVLRTGFIWDDLKEPIQMVHRDVQLSVAQHDYRDLTPPEQQEKLAQFLQTDRERGFKVSTPPLMRYSLIRLISAELRRR